MWHRLPAGDHARYIKNMKGTEKKIERPLVFEYSDHRSFLKTMFAHCKSHSASFSFRKFSKDAGFASPNFLKLVYDGKRNLTIESVNKIARAFKLSKSESEFFSDLVFFNQSNSPEEKNTFYKKMNRSKSYREIKILERDQFDYYSNWYHIAIRELVETKDFREDHEWIAGRIRPKITAAQVEDGIKLLLNLRLLSRDSKGRLIQSEANVTTGAEVRSLAVMNFQRKMLEMAETALEQIDPTDRDVSSATFAISKNQMDELKKRVSHFRKNILSWLSSSPQPKENIYQLGIQVFPLTDMRKTGDGL